MDFKPHMKNLSVLIVLLLIATQAPAQTLRYVTDKLAITMRTGQSTQHNIVRMLNSGSKVEVLETSEDDGYSHVRTADGTDGWVLTRYLVDAPVARDRLVEAQQKLAAFEIDNTQLRNEVSTLSGKLNEYEAAQKQLQQKNEELGREVATLSEAAARPIAIDRENKEFKAKLSKMQSNLEAVQQENRILNDSSTRNWFLTGAGVLILGMILGLLIPRLRWRRKDSWGSL